MNQLASISSTLASLKPVLRSKYFVKSIGLFGSVLREDFTEKSDVDIIVDFSKPVGIEFIDLADFLEKQLSKTVDLVSRNAVKAKYFSHFEKDIRYV